MSIQGEANEFLNLLFGDMTERRFAQVIKVIPGGRRSIHLLQPIVSIGIFEIGSIENRSH